MSHHIASVFIAATLVLSALVSYWQMPLPAGPVSDVPDVMPPHPALLEKAKRGEITLPSFAQPLERAGSNLGRAPRAPQTQTGTLRILAILVDFSDRVHTTSASLFDTLIFEAPKPGRGSVRDYYSEVSYGQIDIVSVNVPSSLDWQRAPLSYSYYVSGTNCLTYSAYPRNCQKLAEDIVDAVSPIVNFSNYDNNHDGVADPIMLIHAGPGAEFTNNKDDIWSHSWSLRNPRTYNNVEVSKYIMMPEFWHGATAAASDMTIGVFAHELGHGLWNLRDLYDRSYASYGIGNWSLMSGGVWNGPNSLGSSPAWPDAWSRALMGVVTPTQILTNTQVQSIPQAYGNPSAGTVFKLQSATMDPNEYFLVENRQRVTGSYDEYLPGNGLLIWHVDENMNKTGLFNDNPCVQSQCCSCDPAKHYLVALEQADGALQLERMINQGDTNDPFPGGSNNRIFGATNMSVPSHNSWYSCNNSCVSVTNISPSGADMATDLGVSCINLLPKIYMPIVLSD